jgi:AcrR family transcriptional regulator
MSIRVVRKRRDAYQHGDLRRALVQAGLKLLSEKGVDGLSLRAAAELTGVSHAAPYRHFRDKDALVAAIAEEGVRLLTAAMRQEIEASGARSVLTRLRAAGRGYLSFAMRHPAYCRTIFGQPIWSEEGPEWASLRASGEEAYGVLRGLVVEGLKRGELRAGDPDQISLACWSLIHGFSMLTIESRLQSLREDPTRAGALLEALQGSLELGLARRV